MQNEKRKFQKNFYRNIYKKFNNRNKYTPVEILLSLSSAKYKNVNCRGCTLT